jgi:arylsulfatase A-like enzyme
MFRLVALAVALGSAAPLFAAPPNVVYIMADDMGWTGLGCQGSTYYETPNIDRLAREGARFTDGYTCGPNCQPTRAALMSGQYGPRTGVYTVGNINRFNWRSRPLRPAANVVKLAPEKVTFAEALKQAGYATGHFGKWHLGQDPTHHPLAQGFDESIVSMGKHFNFNTTPKAEHPKGEYLADFLTDKSIDFIKRHKGGPFLLCLHHFAVHTPLQAKPELVAKFKNKPPTNGQHDPTYAAMTASVDESVGRVVKALDELGLTENTLVIFTSDNGGVGGYDREGLTNKNNTDNAPLRSGKGSLYEGGVRVPYIFRWKGTITPGRVVDAPINSVDLYPTLLELADTKAPPDYPLDGSSYVSLLKGAKTRTREPLYWHFPGYLGAGRGQWRTTPAGSIRDGDWKLIEFFEDGRLELYNLKDDLGEKTNLATKKPEKVKELHAKLVAWRKQIHAPMPTKNKERKTP